MAESPGSMLLELSQLLSEKAKPLQKRKASTRSSGLPNVRVQGDFTSTTSDTDDNEDTDNEGKMWIFCTGK